MRSTYSDIGVKSKYDRGGWKHVEVEDRGQRERMLMEVEVGRA